MYFTIQVASFKSLRFEKRTRYIIYFLRNLISTDIVPYQYIFLPCLYIETVMFCTRGSFDM